MALKGYNTVTNSLIFNCEYGTTDFGNGTGSLVANNVIRDNIVGILGTGGGIFHSNNLFNNEKGMVVSGEAEIKYNLIHHNSNVGLHLSGTMNPTEIYYNTFYDNRIGLLNGYADIQGNIFVDNEVGIRLNNQFTLPLYNYFDNPIDLENGPENVGLGEIITTNQNGDSTDTFYNIYRNENDSSRFFLRTNIEDPYFLYLSAQSKAIDASDTSFKDPDGSIRDMGAIPYEPVLWERISSKEMHNNVKAYPNPVSDDLILEFPTKSTAFISVSDISGKNVMSQYFTAQQKIIIDVSGFKPGMYLINASSDSKVYKSKFYKTP